MKKFSTPSGGPSGGLDDTYSRRWVILGVLVLSLVMVVAGNASLNVALPTLAADLEATQTELQWLVDAYALVFAGLLLPPVPWVTVSGARAPSRWGWSSLGSPPWVPRS